MVSNKIARSFVLKGAPGYVLIAIPDEFNLDLGKVRALIGCNMVHFASEAEVAALFPLGDVAAVPPLSGLVGAPVYLDVELTSQHCVAFPACSRHDLIYVRTEDLKRLPKTSVGSFSEPDYQLEFRHRVLAKATGA